MPDTTPKLRFDINDFRLDKEAKLAGVWIDFGGDAEFKIASFDNPTFTDAFRKATKPYTDLGKDIPDDDQVVIMARTMSQFIVLDWKNVFDLAISEDEPIPYSADAAYTLLVELEWLRSKIIKEAEKLENFRSRATKATVKNSKAASSGK